MNDPSELLDVPVFYLPFSFALTVTEEGLPSSLYQSLAGTPQSFAWDRSHTIDLTAPLKLQWQEEENDRPWKMTLGAAQLGAVSYILYRHIKKYGLY